MSLDTGIGDHRTCGQSLKGKAKELSRLKHYGLYIPVPRSEAKGKHVTTRWEEIPKLKMENGSLGPGLLPVSRGGDNRTGMTPLESRAHPTPQGCWTYSWRNTQDTARTQQTLSAHSSTPAKMSCAMWKPRRNGFRSNGKEKMRKLIGCGSWQNSCTADKRRRESLVTTRLASLSTKWVVDGVQRSFTCTSTRKKA